MTDLDPDVRDRAAQAAEASMSEWGEHYDDVDRRMTLEVVDAVAEVLAETPGEPRDRIVGWLSAAAALTDVTREPCAEALCPEIFRETGQRCDKPDDGHTKHTYALWEHGVQVELAAWVTPDDA